MPKLKVLGLTMLLVMISFYIAVSPQLEINLDSRFFHWQKTISLPPIDFYFWGRRINPNWQLKQGLDIQGGMQVVLQAQMDQIAEVDRPQALQSAAEIISRRVDLYGIGESKVQTAQQGNDYRLIVELPGVKDQAQALNLVGQTAQLDFRLESSASATATNSALALNGFVTSGLSGQDLKRASWQFDQQTSEPVVALEFNEEGRQKFGQITTDNQGKVLAIFIDNYPVALPVINQPIMDGRAVMTGNFTTQTAKNLAIQLNAGALPVPIKVLQQQAIGATLGQTSVSKSLQAGFIGLMLVALFMILTYGLSGVIASIGLVIYALITLSLYKILGVTLTLPGIAGLLLSIGMAVDANILIFERIKEELRLGRPYSTALEIGFGKGIDSIKDANLVTILTALVLINPLDFAFLNTSGLVRGFGLTLLLGVLISLFTGLVVSRNLLRVVLPWLSRSRTKKVAGERTV